MTTIQNVGELKTWLTRNEIDYSNWGVEGTKRVDNLWGELANGDSQIQIDPPVRIVKVTEVIIRRNNYILIELEQEFDTGEIRIRNRVPSEKMKADESCANAVFRCLREEIGVDHSDVTILLPEYKRKEKISDSFSYPGLLSRYIFFVTEVEVNGLPESDFWRDNTAYSSGDPIKRHHWGWVDDPYGN